MGQNFANMLMMWNLTPAQFRDMEMSDRLFIMESYNVRG